MTSGYFDYAIIGASPLAGLLAGLLASAHGKSVLLQGDRRAGHRLTRAVDLSVAAMTRPESWALLSACLPESTRLVSRIGKRAALTRLDPILFADQAHAKQALGHVRHMAAAFGVAVERTPVDYLGRGRDGVLLRDAVMLRPSVLQPALDNWLAQNGVQVLGAETRLSIHDDGHATGIQGDQNLEIGQTVLADDSAILTHVQNADWPGLLQRQVASTILTQPTTPIAAPVMYQLDDGVMLEQQAESGIVAFGRGGIAEFSGALGHLLGKERAFQHAGQSSYDRIVTHDGAPAVGRLAGRGVDVLAGFGSIGAFLAPAIARWLCGQATPGEDAWFGDRLVNRPFGDGRVSDIGDPR